ncbi:flagellar hook-length control protein FliK [Vulgatibacter incomptus]|uniref:Flagellar hook-length control protein FliK n=1 Tax=Vulgatibacter incomptus TaxID=1391653 RepID=A0A0K1PHK6_9BACT|nr:flagellar hook-length control protein FliK [Vulgatibacter incomptus]AKU93023.1 hypothetical protein AKJ08_3410 [Vulgatibacter incomptus]
MKNLPIPGAIAPASPPSRRAGGTRNGHRAEDEPAFGTALALALGGGVQPAAGVVEKSGGSAVFSHEAVRRETGVAEKAGGSAGAHVVVRREAGVGAPRAASEERNVASNHREGTAGLIPGRPTRGQETHASGEGIRAEHANHLAKGESAPAMRALPRAERAGASSSVRLTESEAKSEPRGLEVAKASHANPEGGTLPGADRAADELTGTRPGTHSGAHTGTRPPMHSGALAGSHSDGQAEARVEPKVEAHIGESASHLALEPPGFMTKPDADVSENVGESLGSKVDLATGNRTDVTEVATPQARSGFDAIRPEATLRPTLDSSADHDPQHRSEQALERVSGAPRVDVQSTARSAQEVAARLEAEPASSWSPAEPAELHSGRGPRALEQVRDEAKHATRPSHDLPVTPHLREPAAATAVPEPKAAERAATTPSIDDPSLLLPTEGLGLSLDPGGARIFVRDSRGGDLAVDLRIQDGTLEVRANGAVAPAMAANEAELRVALAGAGLRLGLLAVNAAAEGRVHAAPVPERRRTRADEKDPRDVKRIGERREPSSLPDLPTSVHVKA